MGGNDQKSNGSSSSSSSSKKNKNKHDSNSNSNSNSGSNNLEKPKQPQRGLGVAQLEKIRLHTQMASSGFIPQSHVAFPASPFPNPIFPYVNEEMRIQQGGYQATMQSSSMPFGYGPSSTSSSQYDSHNPNAFMMGVGEHMETTCNIRFGESHPSMTTRWNPNTNIVAMPENHQYIQSQDLVTRHLLSHVKDEQRGNLLISNGSGSQNQESNSENEEINLELKL